MGFAKEERRKCTLEALMLASWAFLPDSRLAVVFSTMIGAVFGGIIE